MVGGHGAPGRAVAGCAQRAGIGEDGEPSRVVPPLHLHRFGSDTDSLRTGFRSPDKGDYQANDAEGA